MLRGLIEHFVAPSTGPPTPGHDDFVSPDEGPGRACAEPAPRTPTGVAVLAPAEHAHALAAALGLMLARRRGTPAVVCTWPAASAGAQWWGAPATPAARRLAVAFGARGLDAKAAGRLVRVRLPDDPRDATHEARRAAAAAGAAPTVLALGGPRLPEFDSLLAEQDLVVVATPGGTDPALGRLAMAGLSPGVTRACVCEVLPAHLGRAVAAAGLAVLPAARRPIAPAVEALS